MWIFTHILLSVANNDPIPTKKKPYLPLVVNRLPVDSQALVEYAYHHKFPLFFSLPAVKTQGTAIHISNGIWLTAAHVTAGGFDMHLSADDGTKIKVELIGLDVHHDIALLSTNETFFVYPVIQTSGIHDKLREEMIRAEGYGNGELTVNEVKNIRYSETESGIVLWDGIVEPGMSGGMLGKTETNEMLGMILSYEPSKNISRALSIHWIMDHFLDLISPEDLVQTFPNGPYTEQLCSYHQNLFEVVTEGLRVVSLSSNRYNLGLQVGDIILYQKGMSTNCDLLSVPKTSILIVQRNNMSFYWIIHPTVE